MATAVHGSLGSSDPDRTVRLRQPTRAELADLETTTGTGLAAAASAAAVTAAAASATKATTAASATKATTAASATDNGRNRADFRHVLDTIAEFALAAM
jgi:hypothetical protein